VLHLDIITRSWTKEEFSNYVDILLDAMNPYPQRNSVLIMDNASTHHFDGLRGMVEARYVSICSLQHSNLICPTEVVGFYISQHIPLISTPLKKASLL
jgi:hypothetical protein